MIINEYWRKMKPEQMNTLRKSELNCFKEQQQQGLPAIVYVGKQHNRPFCGYLGNLQ